jgi:hypothetical protein
VTVTGSNLDFTNFLETLNAIQRNPLLRRLVGNGTVTASALYGVILPTGAAVVSSSAGAEYTIAAPGLIFPFGVPIISSPQPGAVSISSAASVTLIYHP